MIGANRSPSSVMPHSRGLGACIIQDGQPIAFGSKSLTDTETHYANIERELLAIIYGCENSIHTYTARTFIMETDHKPLEMISLKISQQPLHISRGCSSICSSMTWSSCTSQAEKCFWWMPSDISHPEPTLKSS